MEYGSLKPGVRCYCARALAIGLPCPRAKKGVSRLLIVRARSEEGNCELEFATGTPLVHALVSLEQRATLVGRSTAI